MHGFIELATEPVTCRMAISSSLVATIIKSKSAGYRIELGEIEAVPNQHPAVKDSVVVACAA